MKDRLMLIVAAIVLSATLALVQGCGKSHSNNDKKQNKSEQLNLTPEQKAKVDAINEKYRDKEIKLDNERIAEIKEVVTPEQYRKMQQLQRLQNGDTSTMHKSDDEREEIRRFYKNQDCINIEVNHEQSLKIIEIGKKYAEKMNKLNEEGESKDNSKAMNKLRKQRHAELRSILTSEQRKDLDKQLREKGGKLSTRFCFNEVD